MLDDNGDVITASKEFTPEESSEQWRSLLISAA